MKTSTSAECHRGHAVGRDSTRECSECRRIRQRSPRSLLNDRKYRRARADARDLQTIKELLTRAQA